MDINVGTATPNLALGLNTRDVMRPKPGRPCTGPERTRVGPFRLTLPGLPS